MTELWTTSQVAEWWGIAASAVPSTLQRRGVPVDSRAPGRGGQNRYRADLVRQAKARAPGRGARTDLTRPTTEETETR